MPGQMGNGYQNDAQVCPSSWTRANRVSRWILSRNTTSLQESLSQKVHSAYGSKVEMMAHKTLAKTSMQTFCKMSMGNGGLGSSMAIT